jgi:hypothetical protein
MTDLAKGSLEDKTAIAHAIDLLTHYSFDLGNRTALQLIEQWLERYPASWIRWAVIECLYQGRYKAISADQILQLWHRRDQPCYHFSYEFERLVCHKFPRNLALAQGGRKPLPPAPSTTLLPTLPPPALPPREMELDPAEPPAWAALAEQIQQDEPEEQGAAADLAIDTVPTLRSIANLQADMAALIDQATSNLNASAEAMKTKLKLEEAGQSAEESYPPIHQFTPSQNSPEFHTKLKSVANQDPS